MAIKIGGTNVITDARQLANIASVDATTASAITTAGVGGSLVNKPTITSPANASIITGNAIVASSFATSSYYKGTLDNAMWEASIFSNFSNTFSTSYGTTNTTWSTLAVPSTANLTFYVRVRYISDSHQSDWSDYVTYLTGAFFLSQPTITVPGASSNVISTPTITTSAFTTAPSGFPQEHVSTDWEILHSSNNTSVYTLTANTAYKTSLTVPEGTLRNNTEYKFRARHNGNTLAPSAYGETTATTQANFSGESIYTSAGTYSFVVPQGVTSVSAVCVGYGGGGGGHWRGGGGGGGLRFANVNTTGGETLTVALASGFGNEVSLKRSTTGLVVATSAADGSTGGPGGSGGGGNAGSGGSGGTGGNGDNGANGQTGGGGGAAGYTGNGGTGGNGPSPGNAGSGGGGGGGGGGVWNPADGGGVGIYGAGPSGTGGGAESPGNAGSGGSGRTYGGGARSNSVSSPGPAAVRIIWGPGRNFPNAAS